MLGIEVNTRRLSMQLDYTADRTWGYFWEAGPVVQASLEQ